MPRAKTHRSIGTFAGATIAGFLALNQPSGAIVLEVVGGAIGGRLGGMLPDLIEPADHPGHRDLLHSHMCALTLTIGTKGFPLWQALCREQAVACEHMAELATNSGDRFGYIVGAALWRIASGFLPGLVAGYLSHLMLDGITLRSLPLVGKLD